MTEKLKKSIKKIFVISLGIIFLLLGLAGLVLPILQGWLFLIIGLLLLSMYSAALRGFINKHTIKYPKIHRYVGKAEEWTTRIFGAPEV